MAPYLESWLAHQMRRVTTGRASGGKAQQITVRGPPSGVATPIVIRLTVKSTRIPEHMSRLRDSTA